jgi:hypothetical protein
MEGKFINPKTREEADPNNLIRNYVKTIVDPITKEVIEVRPGVGAVGTIAGSPSRAPKKGEQVQEVDFTYGMLNPKQREYFEKAETNYAKDIDDSREFGEILVSIGDLIDSDISAAIPAIKRQLARSVGKEVGVMTDADVKAFSGDQSFFGAMQRFAKMQAVGTMTEKDKKEYRGILDIAGRNINKAIENRAGFHAQKLKQRLPTATMESLRSLLSVDASKPIGIQQDSKVKVQHPDGRKGLIPRENLEKALKQGFKEL